MMVAMRCAVSGMAERGVMQGSSLPKSGAAEEVDEQEKVGRQSICSSTTSTPQQRTETHVDRLV